VRRQISCDEKPPDVLLARLAKVHAVTSLLWLAVGHPSMSHPSPGSRNEL